MNGALGWMCMASHRRRRGWADMIQCAGWCATTSAAPARPSSRNTTMNLNLSIGPLVALIAGILILVMPRMLNYIVAFYLIIVGIIISRTV